MKISSILLAVGCSASLLNAQEPSDSALAFLQKRGAGKPAFEIRGEHFGDQAPKRKRFSGPPCEDQKSIPGLSYCFDFTRFEIGGVKIESTFQSYLDGKLYSYWLSFPTEDHSQLRDILITRYGKPDTTWTEELQNRMGAKFTNETERWWFADGELDLSKYGSKVTEGRLDATSYAGLVEYAVRSKKAAADAAARDLGPPVKR